MTDVTVYNITLYIKSQWKCHFCLKKWQYDNENLGKKSSFVMKIITMQKKKGYKIGFIFFMHNIVSNLHYYGVTQMCFMQWIISYAEHKIIKI